MNPVITNAIKITETYKEYQHAPLPIREAMCHRAQYPGLLPGPRAGDGYAGRCRQRRIVHVGSFAFFGMPGYTPENNAAGKHGGYCFDFSAVYNLEGLSEGESEILKELDTFWHKESTMKKTHALSEMDDSVGFLCPNDIDTLVKKGLPGLIADANNMPESDFRTGLCMVLGTVADVVRRYLQHARENQRSDIADTLDGILHRAPATLAEGLQLILLFELMTHERHYELDRLDVALGDVYVKELDAGTLTEETAVPLIRAFFEMINENGDAAVCRLIMGARSRRNAANADRFITAALKAAQLHRRVTPQVTLRIYKGMDAAVLKLAYETIYATGTFPMLFNDDAIIPGVAEAYRVSVEAANDYYPLGCGEVVLSPHSPGILCVGWDIPRAFDTALRGAAGNPSGDSFEALYAAVIAQYTREAFAMAKFHRTLIDVHNENIAFLMGSVLVNDCMARCKPVLNGGARYNGAVVMGHGFTNTADALTALKTLVYEQKKYTLQEIIEALDADYTNPQGKFDTLKKDLLEAPKYGNDHTEADTMTANLWRDISEGACQAGDAHQLVFFTVSSVNPGGYGMGEKMPATPDGRHAYKPYAIGNAPTAGMDKNGLPALMNSILTTHPANGGTMSNFKVSRAFFTQNRDKFEALFAAYFAGGGLQANITIVNQADLEAALENPTDYPHLMVRLGGWTARFIDLERAIQEEIIRRTAY
jgi:pyruvate-formate lyase